MDGKIKAITSKQIRQSINFRPGYIIISLGVFLIIVGSLLLSAAPLLFACVAFSFRNYICRFLPAYIFGPFGTPLVSIISGSILIFIGFKQNKVVKILT